MRFKMGLNQRPPD